MAVNTKLSKRQNHRALWPCALLIGPVLSGCGGGGSVTGPAPATLLRPATVTLSGTLQDPSGAPLAGYKVVYAPSTTATPHARRAEDVSGALSAVTDAHGFYALSIPTAQITPQATLTVYDQNGTQVQSQALTLDPSQPVQTTVTTVTLPSPPPPPAPPTDSSTTSPPPSPPSPPA